MKFFGILKDSFREAVDAKVFYVMVGLSLFLTLFVMSPVLNRAYDDGVKPYMDGQLTAEPAITAAAAHPRLPRAER